MDPSTFASPNSNACQQQHTTPLVPDRITQFTYDSFDQVLTEMRGLGTSLVQTYVTNTYLARGYLQTQKDANNNLTTLEYENGRLKKRLYPLPSNPNQSNPLDYNQYFYDNNGNVTSERKRNSTTVSYTYDANNRLTFKNLSDNTYSGDVSYGYDLRGLTLYSCFGTSSTAACDGSGGAGDGETNQFDDFGNLEWRKSRMFGTTRELSYLYDLEGNRSRITHPGGVYFSYQRDGLNRVCTLGESTSAQACDTPGSPAFLAMTYSNEGRREKIIRPGGETSGSVTSYATDNALRLRTLTQNLAGSSTTNDLVNTFGYNPANQITSLTQSNTQYNYTEAQNRVGVYEVNGLNQYKKIDGNTVSHDINGNLTADGAGMTFGYDMENRLVSTGGPASSLYYDVLGRLARLTVTATNQSTDFHYDGDALVGEYTNGTLTRYVHGDQVDEPLVQYAGSLVGASYRRYLHADHLGSIIAQTSNSGTVTLTNSYDPYGIPKSSNAGRFGYTGQTWLKDLGLNYYKARIYSPRLGRFLQTDPVFYKDDMNLYAYVGNDPMNRTDPDGLYGRGDGFTDDQWKKFDKVQAKAADRMEKRADKRERKADKLDAKGKEGGDRLRTASSSLREGAAALRSDGSDGKIANAVSANDWSRGKDVAAFVNGVGGNIVTVNLGHDAVKAGGSAFGRVLTHESLHTAGLSDWVRGERAYCCSGVQEHLKQYRSLTPEEQVKNPDYIMNMVW